MNNQQRVEQWHREWLDSDGGSDMRRWGDKINWITADEIARKLDEELASPVESCPVAGEQTGGRFYCTREKGHDGPCAAHQW